MGSKKIKYLAAALLVLLLTGPCKKGLYVAVEGDTVFLKAALDKINPGASVKITVTGVKADGHPMPDQTLVRLEADRGKFLDNNNLTVEAVLLLSGKAEATYQSEADFAPGPVIIKAQCGTAKINPEELTIIILDIDISQLFISADPAKIPPNSDETVITVTAFNGKTESVADRTILLETTAGILIAGSGGPQGTAISLVTDAEGKVSAVLKTEAPATVTASYKEIIQTLEIDIGINQPPVPDFEFSPQNPVSGETIFFNSTSSDPDGTLISQEWNFGDGHVDSGANTTHSYHVSVNKTFSVTLTVTDNDNAVKTKTKPVPVTITPNIPPVAAFSFSPQSPNVGDTIYFISESKDEDGEIVAYQWHFGDGGVSSLTNPSHRYNVTQPTTFNVQLIVTDDGGKTGSVTQPITLGSIDNKPPTADFSYTPVNPVIGDTIQFLSQSTDEDGWITSWQWEFGDGGTSTLENPQYRYNVDEKALFAVKLTVTDNNGQTAGKTETITIGEQENIPPTAAFSFSPSAPRGGDVVYFNAGTSSDPDGEIVQYQWDFGDGVSGSGQTAQHAYNVTVTTTVTVVLTVTDDGGAQDVKSQPVTVTVVVNQPPTAAFEFSPTNPKSGDTVLFNASASTDPDGTIVQYHWDFGDGYTGTGINASHIYNVSSETTFTILLTVTDDDGAPGVTSKTITVTPN